ncbi:transposase (fragment) [Methylacidimicrobium sp. AP8]
MPGAVVRSAGKLLIPPAPRLPRAATAGGDPEVGQAYRGVVDAGEIVIVMKRKVRGS